MSTEYDVKIKNKEFKKNMAKGEGEEAEEAEPTAEEIEELEREARHSSY